jgi:long-chain acyl-CoA synthetase
MSVSQNLGDVLADAPANRTAIVDLGKAGRDRFVSYGRLDELADAAARGLARRGLPPGSVIAVDMQNRAEYLAIVFGIQRAGHVAMPVNYKLPDVTLAYILQDSACSLAFVDQDRSGAYPESVLKVVLGSVAARPQGQCRFEEFADPGPFDPVDVSPESPAELLYTSGSTGRPKGVLLSHASHLWVLRTRLRDLSLEEERVLVAAPFFHMQGLTMSQLVLAGGGTLVLLPRFDARSYIRAIDEHRPTWLTGVPPMMAMILRERDLMDAADLTSVRTIRMGSAPVSETLLTGIRSYFADARVINGYGTTESGPVAFGPHPRGLPTPAGSVGYPNPDVELRLSGPLPERGELEIKSPGAMIGYLRRPDLDDVITPDGFYRTRDLFRRDENGFYYFVSRTDDMIVCGGENIYPGEVERVLEAMPGVSQAGVIGMPDEIKGQKPVAFVVLEAGTELDAVDLQQQFFRTAPAYQYPRRVWFLDSMPITAANKPDRHELRRRASSLIDKS